MALSERDRRILDFERTWYLEPGTKGSRIRSEFELSLTRYYRLRGALIDRRDALDYDPLVVRRLRRDRDRRRRARFEGVGATQGSGK